MSREREAKGKKKAPREPPSNPVETPTPRAPIGASGHTPLAPRTITRRRGAQDNPTAPIEKGSQVRALGGAFEGKTGIVQELDGRGGARVSFGLLAARVEIKDLIVVSANKGRPVLGSSHRKPQPPSS